MPDCECIKCCAQQRTNSRYYTIIIAFVFGILGPCRRCALMPVPGKTKCGQLALVRTYRHSSFLFATKQLQITTYTRFNTPFVRFCGFGMLLKNAFTGRKFITAFFQLVLCHFFRPMHLPLSTMPFHSILYGKTEWSKMWRIRCEVVVVSTTEASRRSKCRNHNLFTSPECGGNFVSANFKGEL